MNGNDHPQVIPLPQSSFLQKTAHLPVSYLFTFSYCSYGSCSKNPMKTPRVVCHSFLQWTTSCQNSPLWPVCLGWPCMAWLIASLSYTRPFVMTMLWSVKRKTKHTLSVFSHHSPWYLPKGVKYLYPHKTFHLDIYSSFTHNCQS